MPDRLTRRRRRPHPEDARCAYGCRASEQRAATQIVAEGDVYVNSEVNRHTVNQGGGDRPSLADDLMPATLASVPVLALVLLLTLTDQTVLLRSILQEGNPLGLALFLLPLFAPTIAASAVYLARGRGWIGLGRRATNGVAMAVAVLCGLFVPLNYLVLQACAFAACLTWIILRRGRVRRLRWRITLVVAVVAGIVVALGTTAGWERRGWDHFGRVVVSRLLDGLTAMNLDDRAVRVISVNDGYAIVASLDYPPVVETMAPAGLNEGAICQLEPRWNQRSIVSWFSGEPADGVPPCLSR